MGMSSHDYEVKTDKTGDRYTCKRKNYRYIIYLFLSLSHTYRFVICLRMSYQGERERVASLPVTFYKKLHLRS